MMQALEILARWYAEGYLDPEFVTGHNNWMQEILIDDDAILGPNNVCMLTLSYVSALDEGGNDLRAANQDS